MTRAVRTLNCSRLPGVLLGLAVIAVGITLATVTLIYVSTRRP